MQTNYLQLFHVSMVAHRHRIQRLAESDNTLVCKGDEINRANEHVEEWLHLSLENL